MNPRFQKGLKPLLIRYMAFFIGFCYLAHPFHRQIKSVFHEISHLIESPNTILAHPSNTSHVSIKDHHSTSGHPIHQGHHDPHSADHHPHIHSHAVADHQHSLLDLLDSLLDSTDRHHSGDDPSPLPNKFDKHIASAGYTIPHPVEVSHSQNYAAREQHVKIGYPSVPYEPPRSTRPLL